MCFTDFSVTWSAACVEAMDLKVKRITQGKHNRKANIRISLTWDMDGYRAPNCGINYL